MQDLLNPRSVMLATGLLGLLHALVLWVQAKSFPKDIRGLRDFARGIALLALASGLLALRGRAPEFVSIVLANGLLYFGEATLLAGLIAFSGGKPHWRPLRAAVASLVVLLAWLTFGNSSNGGNSDAARLFVGALGHVGFLGAGAWFAWRAGSGRLRGRFAAGFLTAMFGIGVLVAVWRIVALPVGPLGAAALAEGRGPEQDPVQIVYLVALTLDILGLAIGCILLANERLRVELEYLATRDPMTGVLNRRAFFAAAGRETERAQRNQRPLAVIVSDIDWFKKVNDTYGHHVGDEVIKHFAQQAQTCLRRVDVLARFGGEEFVILLPETAVLDAARIAERIRQCIERSSGGKLPRYTVSLGVAAARPPASLDDEALDKWVEKLIAAADTALYRAKEGGRNRVEREERVG